MDGSRDSATKVPSIGGRRRDASGSKQGRIGPIRKDVNLPLEVHNKVQFIRRKKGEKEK